MIAKKPYAWSLPYVIGNRLGEELITIKFCRGFHWNYKVEQTASGEPYFFAFKNTTLSTSMFDSRAWDFFQQIYPTSVRVRENILRVADADLIMMRFHMAP